MTNKKLKKKSLVGYVWEDWKKQFKWVDFDSGVGTKMVAWSDKDGDPVLLNKSYDVPNMTKKVRITIEEI